MNKQTLKDILDLLKRKGFAEALYKIGTTIYYNGDPVANMDDFNVWQHCQFDDKRTSQTVCVCCCDAEAAKGYFLIEKEDD
jgi:hypothetical protein